MRSMHALTLAALLLASASALAQDSAITVQQDEQTVPPQASEMPRVSGNRANQAAKPAPQGSVAGRVLLADTRTPARGARVMLISVAALGIGDADQRAGSDQQQMAATSLDGSFFIPRVAPGQYLVLAFAAGYLSPLDGMDISEDAGEADLKAMGKKLMENAPVVQVHGAEIARIDIELQRGAVLSGRVLYSDGAPAAQLPVSAQKSVDAKPGPPQAIDMATVMAGLLLQQRLGTDDQGRFRIAGIPPGSCRLAVVQTFTSNMDMSDAFESVLNPMAPAEGQPRRLQRQHAASQGRAKVYDLKPGDEVNDIEIVLPIDGLRTVRGIVTGKDGAPLNSGTLDLTDTADSAIAFHATLGPGGRFPLQPRGPSRATPQLKAANGGIFDNLNYRMNIPPEALRNMSQQFKQSRAFADTTISVLVGTTDVDSLVVTLPDAPLPGPPKAPSFPVAPEQFQPFPGAQP